MTKKNDINIIVSRKDEITQQFEEIIDIHLENLISEKEIKMLEIRDIAYKLNIHPVHLSNTIKLTTGNSSCDFYEHKILEKAKELLKNTDLNISEIAKRLTYDPSNFTKFFKKFSGETPTSYKKSILK